MNKRLLLIGLLIGLTIVAPVYAQGPWPTEPSNSGIQAINIEEKESAVVDAIYVTGDGTQYILPAVTLTPGESYTWFAQPSEANAFRGAAQLWSTANIAAIAKTEWGASGTVGAASYSAKDTSSRLTVLPLLVIQHYDITSAFTVQNTDLQRTATVNLQFIAQEAVPVSVTRQITIPAGAAFNWAFEGFSADFPDPRPDSPWGWIGAVRITSDRPVVAAAHSTDQVHGFVYAYDGFTALDQTKAYAPLVRHNFADLTTGIQVVDMSGNGGTVQVKFDGYADSNVNYVKDPGESYTYTDKATLDPGSSLTFFQGLPYLDGSGETMPEHFLGSAEITITGSGAAMAVVVNDQTHFAAVNKKHTSGAYSGFFEFQAAETVITPLARNEYFNFTTGVQIQNVSAVDTVSVLIQYTTSPLSGNPNTPPEKLGTLGPGESITFFLPVDWGSGDAENDWLGAAIITTDGVGEKRIVGITNDQDVSAPEVGDTAIFNCPWIPAQSGTVVMP